MKNKSNKNVPVCHDFISHLREEKLKHQDFRASYIRLKFTFVVGLFSIAVALTKLKPEDGVLYIYGLLYIAPLVAVLFDFYILGGEFAVKRIRSFLNEQDTKENSEKIWDSYLSRKPKEFMNLNRLWVTSFIFVASVVPVAIHLERSNTTALEWFVFSIWFFLVVGLGGYLVFIEQSIRKAFYNNRINSDN